MDLRSKEPGRAPNNLRLAVSIEDTTYEVADDWFEDGLQRLAAAFPPGIRRQSSIPDRSPGTKL